MNKLWTEDFRRKTSKD